MTRVAPEQSAAKTHARCGSKLMEADKRKTRPGPVYYLLSEL